MRIDRRLFGLCFILAIGAWPRGPARADENRLRQLKAFIETASVQSGKAPNWLDLFRYADEHKIELLKVLEPVEGKELFAALKEAQKDTLLSEDELRELLAAKQNTISSWRCTARLRRHYTEAATGARLPEVQESRFVCAGRSTRLEDDFDGGGDLLGLHVIATEADGVHRVFNKLPPVNDRTLPAIQASGENRPVAMIASRPEPNIATFYSQPGNVIGQCMLFPGDKHGVGKAGAGMDLVYSLKGEGILLAGEHDVAGTRCVCVATGLANLFLDVEHGFALRKIEHRPKFQTVQVAFVKDCSGFIDCGDGIWLPSKITNTWFNDKGELATTEEIVLSEMAINCEVDPGIFTDFIPAGAFVNDQIKEITYVSGEKGSIAQLIEGSVPSTLDGPSRGISRPVLLVVGNVVVLAGVILVWFWNQRVSAKQGGS